MDGRNDGSWEETHRAHVRGGPVRFPEEMCKEPTYRTGNLSKESSKGGLNSVGTGKTTWFCNVEDVVGNWERMAAFARRGWEPGCREGGRA